MPERLALLLATAPVAWALPATFVAFALLVLVVWRVPRASVFEEAPDGARWRDLRFWATVLVVAQLGIYLLTD